MSDKPYQTTGSGTNSQVGRPLRSTQGRADIDTADRATTGVPETMALLPPTLTPTTTQTGESIQPMRLSPSFTCNAVITDTADNSNGSYYYSNPNGSSYYNNGSGSSSYIAPSGGSSSSGSKK